MKKFFIISIAILLSSIIPIHASADDGFEHKIQENRKSIKDAIVNQVFYERGNIYADITEADLFLELLHTSRQDLSGNQLFLIFPNVSKVSQNIRMLSKRLQKITIYLLEDKTNAYGMKNRSNEEFKQSKYKDSIKGLKNVEIIPIKVAEKKLKGVYFDSFTVDILKNPFYREVGINLSATYQFQ